MTTAGEQVLVEKYVENFDEAPPGWFLTKLEDDSLRFGTGPAFEDHGVTSAPLSLPANTWIHFAARRKDGLASIFVNGTEVAAAPFVDHADSNASLKFGHRGSPSDTPGSEDERGFFLNGRIDEVELFVGRALSDAEIQAIFNAGSTGKCKEVDHFKCYEAKGEPVNVTVTLQDQFGVEPQVLVGTPKLFCNPVDKNGEGIANPAAHLTCYEIKGEDKELVVSMRNQFGEQVLKVEKSELLCVPSEKISVVPDDDD
jgi:Concanavalin A-like lectin/glucanases superfamily